MCLLPNVVIFLKEEEFVGVVLNKEKQSTTSVVFITCTKDEVF